MLNLKKNPTLKDFQEYVKKLSGSIKVSSKIRDLDKIIVQAKKKYFDKKLKREFEKITN